jgi:hypothetical protein
MIRGEHRIALWIGLIVAAGCGGGGPAPAAERSPAAEAQSAAPAASPDATRPNRVMDPSQWTDPQQRAAYTAAKKYAHVLEKLYCHCRCKENIGHRALVECFESDHGSHCDVCMTEAMIAARMTEQGRNPAEIQKAIDDYYAST